MLKELTREDWLSLLAIPEEMIPEVLVLRGTRNLNRHYERYKQYFHDVFEIDSPNSVFEDVFIGYCNNTPVGYASVYGDCMASEVTHLFGVLGTRLVIQTGCCGALKEGIAPGDSVVPTAAYCGEGASQYYTSDKEIKASSELIRLIPDAGTLHKGPIWTTSALLAEGRKDIRRWGNRGYIAVDMETAATFAVADYFSMDRLSVLFVFDNPCQGNHLLMTDAEKEERRASGEHDMITTMFSLIDLYMSGLRG